MQHIAIIGSGPTGIYTAKYLIESGMPMHLTMFEAQAEAGKGTPYHQDWNDRNMLANIASIELPPVGETLLDWLRAQPESQLLRYGVIRDAVDERTFFPRVVLGEYFTHSLQQLKLRAAVQGITFEIKANQQVSDVSLVPQGIMVEARHTGEAMEHHRFDYVVMATGHVWPKQTEIRPGYFLSPWPASALGTISQCAVGIRGTSLSGIDAAVALAVAHGAFVRMADGQLCYLAEPGSEGFNVTMLSRKGVLPEADFYCPIPYVPLELFTPEAIAKLCRSTPATQLLDAVFALFKAQLTLSDPDYAGKLGLKTLSLEDFSQAYFHEREQQEPFAWAKRNLAEAKANAAEKITVGWRYAILRMHEVFKEVVGHLTAADHQRFTQHLRPVFVDDYATVPHESVERLIALHEAGKLKVLRLGEAYEIDTQPPEGGATLTFAGERIHFPAFIEAMGQRALSVREFPFPSLWAQGVIQNATAPHIYYSALGTRIKQPVEIGGIELDAQFHPLSAQAHTDHLYCLSIPFMLSQFPFAQGITSSHDMGKQVAADIERQWAATVKHAKSAAGA